MSDLIERIQRHIVEEGDCWNWTGALQGCGCVPTMNYQRKVGSVRRFVLLAQGKAPVGKMLATYTCGNTLCVNPEHTAWVTRKTIQQRNAKDLGYMTSPVRMKRISDKARQRSKLDLNRALAVRHADGTQRDIAARFGISQATVSKIKRGETWRDYTNPFARLAA